MNAMIGMAGVALILLGLLFAGQGLGYIPWPSTSFMIGQMRWFYIGAGMVLAGIVLMMLPRR